jgi:hypothetical protein
VRTAYTLIWFCFTGRRLIDISCLWCAVSRSLLNCINRLCLMIPVQLCTGRLTVLATS